MILKIRKNHGWAWITDILFVETSIMEVKVGDNGYEFSGDESLQNTTGEGGYLPRRVYIEYTELKKGQTRGEYEPIVTPEEYSSCRRADISMKDGSVLKVYFNTEAYLLEGGETVERL